MINIYAGMLYISQHFDHHTRSDPSQPRILIVDGHSSHICWPVIQYALDHNIYMIQLPSKATHILQPLDVGCFALLQRAYEEQLREWLHQNPIQPICKVDFLNLLFNARTKVYTQEIIKSAWKNSGCYPVDMDTARGGGGTHGGIVVRPNESESSGDRALPTPLLIRKLTREAGQKLLASDIDNGTKRALFESVVDTATAKLIEYRDIAPRATTLNKLRNGKTRRTATKSRRQLGTARVLSRQVLNQTLKKLETSEAAKREREKAILDRKAAMEAKKHAKQALEQQWKLEYAEYIVQEIDWREECASLTAEWHIQRDAARMAHKRPPKKPTLPPKPKRPVKSRIEEGGVGEPQHLSETLVFPEISTEVEIQQNLDSDDSDIEMLRDSELDCFAANA